MWNIFVSVDTILNIFPLLKYLPGDIFNRKTKMKIENEIKEKLFMPVVEKNMMEKGNQKIENFVIGFLHYASKQQINRQRAVNFSGTIYVKIQLYAQLHFIYIVVSYTLVHSTTM